MTPEQFRDYEQSLVWKFEPPMLGGAPIYVNGEPARWQHCCEQHRGYKGYTYRN